MPKITKAHGATYANDPGVRTRAGVSRVAREPEPNEIFVTEREVLGTGEPMVEVESGEDLTGDGSGEPLPEATDFRSLSYNDLRALAAEHGLSGAGSKEAILQRLADHLGSQPPTSDGD